MVPETGQAWGLLDSSQRRIAAEPRSLAPRLERLGALVKLGLRTLVRLEAKQLIDAGAPAATVEQLTATAEALPNDRIELEERETTLRVNLAHLRGVVEPSEEQLEAWRREYGRIAWLRALDGNIVRVDEQAGRVGHLNNIRGMAEPMLRPLLDTMAARTSRPIIYEGMDPPWFFSHVLSAPGPSIPPGFSARLLVVQRDRGELLNGFACTDLGSGLGDGRIEWFIGEDAASRARAWLTERVDVSPPEAAIRSPFLRLPAEPGVSDIKKELDSLWHERLAAVSAAVLEPRTPRDRSYWQNRFNEAASGAGAPLRVMVITSRFSTYLRYICADLCAALERLGMTAKLHIEPDDHSVCSALYHLEAAAAFKPDLLVCPNYTRRDLAGRVPPDVPFVCWVQDAMPHLFEQDQGEKFGELDFVLGMIKDELADRYGYPRSRSLWVPMVASEQKFASGPAPAIRTAASVAADRDVDIAWVTHQGGSVEDHFAKLVEQSVRSAPKVEPVLSSAVGRIERIVADKPAFVHHELRQVSEDLVEQIRGIVGTAPELEQFHNSFVVSIAERVFRMQTAAWITDMAERRGWRVRFFGRGWDGNPAFAQYAAGPVEHDDDLRRCYNSAALHIHASLNQPLHQRVAECAFSGGLVACRITRDVFSLLNGRSIVEAHHAGLLEDDPDMPGFRRASIDGVPQLRRMIDRLRTLGLCGQEEFAGPFLAWSQAKIDAELRADSEIMRAHTDAFESVSDLLFAGPDGLETIAQRSIEDESWRADRSAMLAQQLEPTMGIGSFIERMLAFVDRGLGKGLPAKR